MKRFSLLLVPLFLVLLSFAPAFASDTAKSLGMAGAVVAIDGLSAPIYNPALLANMTNREVGLSVSYVRDVLNADYTSLSSDGTQLVALENLGLVMMVGPGTAYVGFDTNKRYFGLVENIPGDGFESNVDTTIYSPTVAYGLRIFPALAVGASLSYIYKAYNANVEWDAGNVPVYKISRGIGVNLGALYALSPQVDLGGSLSMLAPVSINGYADTTDLAFPPLDEDYVIKGTMCNPSTIRLGGSYRPKDNITIGLQFDVINGYSLVEKQDYTSDSYYIIADSFAKASTVIGTRIGAEYVLSTSNAEIPLRAGLCFIPDNNMIADVSGDAAIVSPFADAGTFMDFKVPYSTIFTLGAGYRTGMMDLGIAAEWMTGESKITVGSESLDFTSLEQKIVASATFKI
jgi:long-subunit fatty acid transport protein